MREEDTMRWYGIRRAEIKPEHRAMFEQYGVNTTQVLLATNGWFRVPANVAFGGMLYANAVQDPLLAWLTEQYDRAERKETWSITMEAAITAFVLAELVLAIFRS